jgi:DNA-binding transcriptional LysR family regulator
MPQDDPLSIRQLQVFVTLVEQASFTRAARYLGLSQSTVSGHIADLERRLGMRLVGRDRTGVEATAAGEVLLRPARDALRAERHARMAAAELSGVLSGTLSLGGSTIPAVYLIPGLVRAFREQHAGITINLLTGDSSEIVDFVHAGEVDVGVIGIQPPQRGLQSVRIGGDELVLIVGAQHPLAGSGTVDLDTVRGHPIVLREEGSGTRRAMFQAFGDVAESDLDVACQVGSTEAVKAAVRAGIGLSFVSALSVRDEREAGALVVVPVEGFRVERAFYMVSREAPDISPAGRAFWNSVRPT